MRERGGLLAALFIVVDTLSAFHLSLSRLERVECVVACRESSPRFDPDHDARLARLLT